MGMIHELHELICFGEGRTAKYSPVAEHSWLKQGGRERRRRKKRTACGGLDFFPLFHLLFLTAWMVGFSFMLGTGTDFLSLCDIRF